jgi:hypothetical protein
MVQQRSKPGETKQYHVLYSSESAAGWAPGWRGARARASGLVRLIVVIVRTRHVLSPIVPYLCWWVWMVVRFVCVIRVPVCARVSPVCRLCPRVLPCLSRL